MPTSATVLPAGMLTLIPLQGAARLAGIGEGNIVEYQRRPRVLTVAASHHGPSSTGTGSFIKP